MPGGIETAIRNNVLYISATGDWRVDTAEKIRQEKTGYKDGKRKVVAR